MSILEEGLRASIWKLEKQVRTLQEENAELRKRAETAEQELRERAERVNEMERSLKGLHSYAKGCEAEIHFLTERTCSLSNQLFKNKVDKMQFERVARERDEWKTARAAAGALYNELLAQVRKVVENQEPVKIEL